MRNSLLVTAVVLGFFVGCSSSNTSSSPPVTDSGVVDAGVLDAGADAGADAGLPACCTGVTVSKTGGTIIDGGAIYSSTKLAVNWSAATGTIARYRVTSLESVTDASVTILIDAGTTATTLTSLKSSTSYAVTVAGCVDFACTSVASAGGSSTGTTEEEFWQIQGSPTKDNYDGGLLIVAGGNTKAYVIRYPADAGAPSDLAGYVRLYYDAIYPTQKGINVAISTTVASSTGPTSFTSHGSDAGIFIPSSTTTYINSTQGVLTSEAIPLPASMGSKIRMFFEGQGADNKVRIMSIDSNDGYRGEDFNAGPGTKCADAGDYTTGGCIPTIVVGVEADDAGTGLVNARQHKIGYPTLTNWIWDGAVGTFMVITSHDACGTTVDGLSYATWNGSKWNVEKTPDGGTCARFFVKNGHGPVIVHLGASRYKLYYEDSTNGNNNKPFRMIYADGTRTGGATTIEFDDWELSTAARHVNFLWPSGNPVSASNESGLGDHVIYLPTGSVDTQLMYMNLGGLDDPTWATAPTGLGMAVLVNP